MLTLLDVDSEAPLLGKIIKTIGRRSRMKDLSELENAERSLREHLKGAWECLAQPLKRLFNMKIQDQEELLLKVEQAGGWQTFLNEVSIIGGKPVKTGSQKDSHLKAIIKFAKTREQKEKDVKRLQDINQDSSLDSVQASTIRKIKEGRSVLILGPPGSGKTHCALYTLDVFALRHSNEIVIYVAPTVELVLQAFANLVETFPSLSIGIVSGLITKMNKKANILVGTPQELWVLLAQMPDAVWSTAIFDEIHTITEQDMGYGDAMKHLLRGLSRFENPTLVALSATIDRDDVGKLKTLLSDLTGISDIQDVTLSPSPVPVKHVDYECASLTPEVLFRIFRRLGSDGTLVFARNDVITWELFLTFLTWLESMNMEYYGALITQVDDLNSALREAAEHRDECRRLEKLNCVSDKVSRDLRMHESREVQLLAAVKNKLLNIVEKSLKNYTKQAFEETASDMDCMIASIYGITLNPGQTIPLVVKAILSDILANTHQDDTIPYISSIGPYFCFADPSRRIHHREFEAFCRMAVTKNSQGKEIVRIDSRNESEWTAINTLVKFAEAENICVGDVKHTVKVTVRAFQYGLALMMPSLPFVVTQTVRKYLNERKLPFIFATQDLAVGISYPLRNVVIVGNGERDCIKPSLIVQMAGRAGRRGFDTDARIVYINIPDRKSRIEPLANLVPPVQPYGSVDAMSCSVHGAEGLLHDLKIMFSSKSGLCDRATIDSECLQMLVDCMRHEMHPTHTTSICRFLETPPSEICLITTDEKEHACQILEDCRCLLSVCQHLHWCVHNRGERILAEDLKRFWMGMRRVNNSITKQCFL